MKKDKEIYRQLITILEKEDDNEAQFIIKQLESSIKSIDEFIDGKARRDNLEQLYDRLINIYKKINHPHIGLSDYFIWKGDYNERMRAN
ncbi:hypothetical protein [Salipaludibacillus agaradhaerens]|uniref:hypothetical protein n=1 Tax=Salipaludibacillus agaradhaerens TaxID=76935 RepID=UPI0009975E0F|nr:hypothetical protein [Salipaludibacillus agaradhaerens]